MRTVDGDDGHRTIAFDQHAVSLGHVGSPLIFLALAPSFALDGGLRQSNETSREAAFVIARSEATKQSSFDACANCAMDCFASLAMTGAQTVSSLPVIRR